MIKNTAFNAAMGGLCTLLAGSVLSTRLGDQGSSQEHGDTESNYDNGSGHGDHCCGGGNDVNVGINFKVNAAYPMMAIAGDSTGADGGTTGGDGDGDTGTCDGGEARLVLPLDGSAE